MTQNPQPIGVDLARVALRAAKVAAQKNGGGRTAQPKPPTTRVVRRDGREPCAFGVTEPGSRPVGPGGRAAGGPGRRSWSSRGRPSLAFGYRLESFESRSSTASPSNFVTALDQ